MVRWGILGCGDVTEKKSGPGFQKADGSALVAVMRRRGELAADFARRHGVPRWYDDAAALIADPEVDAVYIATPPGDHERLALLVCAAGKPAYVEKPMARNHAECQRMIAAFAAAGLPLYVAYYRRALARFRAVRELVASGALGVVTGVLCRLAGPYHRGVDPAALPWRLQAERSGGGLLLDLGCHTLDVLDFVLGPLTEVRGDAANLATPHVVEDAVAMTFRAAGAPGVAHFCFASDERVDEIAIYGDRAALRLATFGAGPIQLSRGGAVERIERDNPPHIQQPFIQSMVDELRGRGRCDSTGLSAARTQAIMDAVLASYYGGRADGFWAAPEAWPGRRR